MKIAVLASGKLGYTSLLTLFEHPENDVVAVLTDRKSDGIIAYAEAQGISLFAGNPRNGKAADFIRAHEIEVLVSINYLFLIEEDLISWPSRCAFNLHGSLLPKYRGRTPHVWSIINGEQEAGVTAHLIVPECDAGAVLDQVSIRILPHDTGQDVLKKYEELYPSLIQKVLDDIHTDELNPQEQDETKATYFGKRTPDDGEIIWDWSAERIRNWIRAQAYPYPGAFTWVGDKKLTIDQVDKDDFRFHQDDENGKILSVNPVRVKTPDGVLKLTIYREKQIEFITGNKLGK